MPDVLRKGLVAAGLILAAWSAPGAAQDSTRATAGARLSTAGPIAVYLDCRSRCDSEFFRTEITYVNWVRDRQASDVHLLITGQGAGAGGEELTVAFIGLRALEGRSDTLTYTTNPTTTSDERRRGMAQVIALGLVQFAARSSIGPTLRVIAGAPGAPALTSQTSVQNDPWNAWVFTVGMNGSLNGERAYRGRDVELELESRRITADWKTEVDYSFSYSDNQAVVQETDSLGVVISEETYINIQRDWRGELLQVKSLGPHWSAGGNLEVASQTFRNQRLRVQARAAMEVNLFPYSEVTRRELTVRYGVGLSSFRYADTTVFDRIRETLPSHFLEATYRTRQPWGSASVNAEHRNFLTDASKRTTEVNGDLNVRVFKGFNVTVGGGYEWIRDQIYLPRGQRDAVDVLLRRRALLTGFQYRSYVGVSYTFGSIFNNVVNPRF